MAEKILTFTAKTITDKAPNKVIGRVIVEKDGKEIAVVVPANDDPIEVGTTITVGYFEEDVLGGRQIVHARLIKPKVEAKK